MNEMKTTDNTRDSAKTGAKTNAKNSAKNSAKTSVKTKRNSNETMKNKMRLKLKPYVEQITDPDTHAGKNMYVCPLCGSGSGSVEYGSDSDGAFSIKNDGVMWHCFSCGKGGDIFDLIREHEGMKDFKEQYAKAVEMFGDSNVLQGDDSSMSDGMGMFAEEYKRPVPRYIRTLGVVTSPTGAAIQDILKVARRRRIKRRKNRRSWMQTSDILQRVLKRWRAAPEKNT